MKRFKKVAIVGVGLIGGSLAWAIKKHRLAAEVAGVCRHEKNARWAVAHHLIDTGSTSLDIIRGADCVILATPVETILRQAPAIARLVGSDCVVTDVGSTKARITKRLGGIFPNFIGSHPMAGSEKRGVQFAAEKLFEGSLCILTPARTTTPRARRLVENLWKNAGARTTFMTPARHDRIIASVSHLPHAVACALINSVSQEGFPFAASGLKDTTRIAASDAVIWSEIFLSNRDNLLANIAEFEHSLKRLKNAVSTRDAGKLRTFLRTAGRKRLALP